MTRILPAFAYAALMGCVAMVVLGAIVRAVWPS